MYFKVIEASSCFRYETAGNSKMFETALLENIQSFEQQINMCQLKFFHFPYFRQISLVELISVTLTLIIYGQF